MLQTPGHFKQALLSCFSFTPTPDQLELMDKLSDFISNDTGRDVLIIRGYAGTGKTKMIADLSRVLPSFKKRSVLLAPTGRAAKVLSNYAERPAQTIHRKIYKKESSQEGGIIFSLSPNLHKNTIFIVDEASMIGESSGGENSYNNLLNDLIEYVFSGDDCKLILSGDTA
ncbi:MAG: AAA family ATPase, partial [Bacteroidia bacterium]